LEENNAKLEKIIVVDKEKELTKLRNEK